MQLDHPIAFTPVITQYKINIQHKTYYLGTYKAIPSNHWKLFVSIATHTATAVPSYTSVRVSCLEWSRHCAPSNRRRVLSTQITIQYRNDHFEELYPLPVINGSGALYRLAPSAVLCDSNMASALGSVLHWVFPGSVREHLTVFLALALL